PAESGPAARYGLRTDDNTTRSRRVLPAAPARSLTTSPDSRLRWLGADRSTSANARAWRVGPRPAGCRAGRYTRFDHLRSETFADGHAAPRYAQRAIHRRLLPRRLRPMRRGSSRDRS